MTSLTIADRSFGVEIEAGGATHSEVVAALTAAGLNCRDAYYSHATTPHWKVVSDCSLTVAKPFELVSPVLRGAEGLRQVKVAMDALVSIGCKVNRSCGMHVHVDARDLGVAELRRVCKSFIKHEADFDAVVPLNRRQNDYARSNSARFDSQPAAFKALDACKTTTALRTVMCGPRDGYDRYFKLNLQSLLRHGTVEFRQHGGTVEADKALAWITLVVGMTANSATAKTVTLAGKPANRFDLLLSNAPAASKAYLRARRAHFAGR